MEKMIKTEISFFTDFNGYTSFCVCFLVCKYFPIYKNRSFFMKPLSLYYSFPIVGLVPSSPSFGTIMIVGSVGFSGNGFGSFSCDFSQFV